MSPRFQSVGFRAASYRKERAALQPLGQRGRAIVPFVCDP